MWPLWFFWLFYFTFIPQTDQIFSHLVEEAGICFHALQSISTVAVRAEQGFGSSLGWQQTYVQGQKSEFRIKPIWFAVNGIITIHCNVMIITAAETYVHQIHHEWFHYGTRRYQWETCSSFPYRSKTQRSAFVLGWRRAQIDTATHCTVPV